MKDHGLLVVSDPGIDKPLNEIPTTQCVHCGGHFPLLPGSGRIRGWCMNCNGMVCGPGCADCIPLDLMLGNMEKGKDIKHKSIIVPTSFH